MWTNQAGDYEALFPGCTFQIPGNLDYDMETEPFADEPEPFTGRFLDIQGEDLDPYGEDYYEVPLEVAFNLSRR